MSILVSNQALHRECSITRMPLDSTVMDAEMLGISIALEAGHTKIALDSQGAISRAAQLATPNQQGHGSNFDYKGPIKRALL